VDRFNQSARKLPVFIPQGLATRAFGWLLRHPKEAAQSTPIITNWVFAADSYRAHKTGDFSQWGGPAMWSFALQQQVSSSAADAVLLGMGSGVSVGGRIATRAATTAAKSAAEDAAEQALASATRAEVQASADALGGTHPLSAINPTGGRMNCGRCAIALDSTLSGAPASALGGGAMHLGDVAAAAGKPASAWGYVRKSTASITSEMAAAGPGARGIVYGGRGTPESPGMGHYYNVMNQNGLVVYMDGQVGSVVDATDGTFTWFALLRTN
jgi:hypothetical protein